MTPVVRLLLVTNAVVYALQLLADRLVPFTAWFGLDPVLVAKGAVWQLVTYAFLHGGIWHLLFNILALFMFGTSVEMALGAQAFAGLYATSAIGAGLCSLAVAWGQHTILIGASGGIFGVLMAYALLFPYRPVTLLVMFVLPVTLQARWLVAIFAWIELMLLMGSGTGRGLGQVAHLTGLLFGWVYLRGPGWVAGWREASRRRRLAKQYRFVHEGRAAHDALQAEVDGLLDKISKHGMAGLTEAERRRLYEASEELKRL
ncbi:MAG: rhomboid family intramembrane serine protease [Candidatus Coatesbacteria bacterium]